MSQLSSRTTIESEGLDSGGIPRVCLGNRTDGSGGQADASSCHTDGLGAQMDALSALNNTETAGMSCGGDQCRHVPASIFQCWRCET